MAAQFLTTSRLNNIINMITLGQQSGILRVIRGQGPTREIGQIKFVDGEPVTALLGQVTGSNALTVLSNWGECVYSFDEHASQDGTDGEGGYDPGRPPSDPGQFTPQRGVSSGSWPSYGFPSTPLTSQPSMPAPYSNGRSTASSLPGFPSQPGYMPQTPNYPSEPPRNDNMYGSSAAYPIPSMANSATLSANALASVPRRTVLAEAVDQLPLDRRERMLLLLVDSRRNLSDLARLTRRSEREVLNVLEHLATLGLVQLGG